MANTHQVHHTGYRGFQPMVEITRGAVLESVYLGALVVADPAGNLIAYWGDPQIISYLSSSAKPLQTVPLVESGAAKHFGLTDEQIAVVCASHTGTNAHVNCIASIQARIGVDEPELVCGTRMPFDAATIQKLLAAGISPNPNQNNCSGKHSGMLALAHFLGVPLDDYINPRHPVQRQILSTIAVMCDLQLDDVQIETDGCSAPNFAVPLQAAATAFARLADPWGLSQELAVACRRIFRAMTNHPLMAGGNGRFDTELMQATNSRLLVKAGAEGYMTVAIPSSRKGYRPTGLGMVVKVMDGDIPRRAVPTIVVAALRMLELLSDNEMNMLSDYNPGPLKNYKGLVVGERDVCFHREITD